MQFFEKIPEGFESSFDTPIITNSTGRGLLESSKIIDLDAFCVELLSFYCSKGIQHMLVSMSYTSFLYKLMSV